MNGRRVIEIHYSRIGAYGDPLPLTAGSGSACEPGPLNISGTSWCTTTARHGRGARFHGDARQEDLPDLPDELVAHVGQVDDGAGDSERRQEVAVGLEDRALLGRTAREVVLLEAFQNATPLAVSILVASSQMPSSCTP
jgi:hypothetical protein